MDGLELPDPMWELAGASEPSRFIGALPKLVSPDALLFLEGGAHPPELRSFLGAQNVTVAQRPALGTMWPAGEYFSIRMHPEVVEGLAARIGSLSYPEVCNHLHVFREDRILVSGYDAFSDPFYASADVPEENLREFCAVAGCSYRRA